MSTEQTAAPETGDDHARDTLEDHVTQLRNLAWTVRIVSWAIEEQYHLGGYNDALIGVAEALNDRLDKLDEYGLRLSPGRDPIFPLIEAHHEAAMAILAECGKKTDVPVALVAARHAAERKLFATKPTTLKGMLALMDHVNYWWANFYNDTSAPLEQLFVTFARTDAERAAVVP